MKGFRVWRCEAVLSAAQHNYCFSLLALYPKLLFLFALSDFERFSFPDSGDFP